MTGMQAFHKGCGIAARTQGLLLAQYAANLLLALPLAIGFQSMMRGAFGSSMAPEALLPGFDATAVRDALAGSGDAFRALQRAAIPIALLGMLVNTLLAGGILHILIPDHPFSPSLFFEGIGRFAGRFLRLWLVLSIIGVVLFVVLSLLFGMIAGVAMQSDSERTVILGTLLGLFVYSPLWLLVMAGDYAKIQIVSFDLQSAWKAVGHGVLFLLRNPRSTILLQLFLFLLLLLAVAVYFGIDALVETDTAGTVFLLFLIQQAFLGARIWIRTAAYAGAAALFEARRPRPVIFYGWEDSPERESA